MTPKQTDGYEIESPPIERVILVRVFSKNNVSDDTTKEELISLAITARCEVVAEITQKRTASDRSSYIGKGKAEEIRLRAESAGIDTLIFNTDLTPGQATKLEEITNCRIIDRTELILTIFADRAQTAEAKLQIELAQLNYSLPRLTGMWHHFSRLGAGIGTRGPGETQLEIDRRRARARISLLEKKLRNVEKRWAVMSSKRESMFRVTIVGYTNVGKSTLMNVLCGTDIITADRPFATLDTTSRRLELPDGTPVLFSDTVGFIDNLPETLLKSFRTTLDVAKESDLLLIAVDRSAKNRNRRLNIVRKTLKKIGVDKNIPRLIVWTKYDVVGEEEFPSSGVCVSSYSGIGVDDLKQAILKYRDESLDWFTMELRYHDSHLINRLYRSCIVRGILNRDDGTVRITAGAIRGYESIASRFSRSESVVNIEHSDSEIKDSG